MKIFKHANVDLHWWGKDILLIKNIENFYVLDEIEAFFVKQISKSNQIETVTKEMSLMLGVKASDIKEFIEIFMQNFSEYFYFDNVESSDTKIHISGKEFFYYPLEIHASLTSHCPQKCKHCYKNADVDGKDIDIHDFFDFLDRMQGYVPYLYLSGGEPTLHPDFCKIMDKYADTYNICIATSGIGANKYLKDIQKAKRGMVLSIYSSHPNRHDEFVDLPGSYNQILQLISNTKEYNISVGVSTILTENNYEDIALLVEQLVSLDVNSITVGRMMEIGRAKSNKIKRLEKIPNYVLEGIELMQKKFKNVNFMIEECAGNATLPLSAFGCSAGTLLWSVYETGEIQPCGVCSISELSMGTIRELNNPILSNRQAFLERVNHYLKGKHTDIEDLVCPFLI